MKLLQDILTQIILFDIWYALLGLIFIPTVGFFMVSKLMARGIDLKDHLFEHDNPVAGLEFGGILVMMFYLTRTTLTGPAHTTLLKDLFISGAFILGLTLLLALVRGALNDLVHGHNERQIDDNGKNFDLNHEIYEQRNWAAAFCSISVMLGATNGIAHEGFFGPTPWRDLCIALLVGGLGIALVPMYRMSHLKGQSFLKLMFTRDNPAAGVSLLGFCLTGNIILSQVVRAVKSVDTGFIYGLVLIVFLSALLLLFVAIGRLFIEKMLKWQYKLDVASEIFEQKNVGAGCIDAAILVGLSWLITILV